jgi:ABC-type arginine transport system permease subunit
MVGMPGATPCPGERNAERSSGDNAALGFAIPSLSGVWHLHPSDFTQAGVLVTIASVISLEELMRRSRVLMQESFQVLELYCVAGVYYLLLTTLWSLVQVRLETHYGRGYAEMGVAAANLAVRTV